MQPQPASAPAPTIPFRFTGSGGEYFRIWIVNLLLSIVTLGIYSAWAKVRRNRYFYGNTRLGNASFQYLAEPLAILRGRLVAAGVFVVYSAVTHLWPQTMPLFLLAFVVLLPWLIVKSMLFRMRNTAFRNIRFDFKGAYGEAAKIFLLMPLLIPFTLGLILPYLNYAQQRFITDRSTYGTTAFAFKPKVSKFYGIYGMTLLIFFGGILLLAATAGALAKIPEAMPYVLPGTGLAFVALFLFIQAYSTSRLSNLAYNHTSLAGHAFSSNLGARGMLALYITNVLGIVLTLGLFIPWAKVRIARYQADHLRLLPRGDLNQFFAAQTANVGSVGEEMGEMFDVNVGI